MSGDYTCKTRWEKENVIHAHVKINRNQDPDLYAMLENAESRGSVVRQLMRLGFKALTEVPGIPAEQDTEKKQRER